MIPTLVIDGRPVDAAPGVTILRAAAAAGIYLPTLCWHPELEGLPGIVSVERVLQGEGELRGTAGESHHGCDLCVVEVAGRGDLVHACWAKAADVAEVRTDTPAVRAARRAALARLLASHPHACLSCRQKHGCPRDPCSLNVPREERCCAKLGHCEIERLWDWLDFDAPLPAFVRDAGRTARSALFSFDWNLCVGCLRCVRACASLRGVGALAFVVAEGRCRPGFRAGTPEESGCRFCGTCVEVCPGGAALDREPRWTEREQRLIPCRSACPARLDVPAYVRAVGQGRPDEAARIVRESVPFGRVLGRVCHAPCQDACRRGALDDPIAVCAVKRFACDATPAETLSRAPGTGRRVAVVGAGPAGLAAAWFLARKGHGVTAFEAAPAAGGMLRWGIPAFRLAEEVVRAEVGEIERLGVEIRTSTRVADAGALRRGFDAVLVAAGQPLSRRLDLAGVDWHGLEFLRAARGDDPPRRSGATLVIGGGNVALDCALTARRLGAAPVRVVSLEAAGAMPAFAWELERARAEGVEVLCGWGPVEIAPATAGKSCRFRRCVSVLDAQGRFAPRFDDAVGMAVEAATVIAAIGQRADPSLALPADAAGGVFVAGSALSVVDAIAAGKAAAAAVDRFLGGDGALPAVSRPAPPAAIGAGAQPARFAARRVEVADGYGAEEAAGEAARCLQCDLRLALEPVPMPPAVQALLELAGKDRPPEKEGVLRLFGPDRALLQITGTANLRGELDRYAANPRVRWFAFEVEPYYTKRESELLQAYLQQHGRLPPGLDDLDDLY